MILSKLLYWWWY